MAVPSTSTFILNFDEVLDAAFARIGGEQMSGYNARSAKRAIQIMMSEWTNRGVPMWTIEQFTTPIIADQQTFTLPGDSVDVTMEASIKDASGVEILMIRVGRAQYQSIALKTVRGRPNQFFVDRSRDVNTVYLYPVPERTYDVVGWYKRKFRDVSSYTDNLDIPYSYYEPTIAGVAYFIARELPDIDEGKLARLKSEYDTALSIAADGNQDMSDWYLAPDLTMYSGYMT